MAYPYTSYQNPWQQGYYPVYQQSVMPQMTQPVQQSQQSYSPAINQNGIIWISGEQEASMYPIAPNNAVALWTKDGKTIYLKSADATGKPNMKIYDLVEREQAASEAGSSADGKPAFATKEDLAIVVDAVKSFDGLLGSLKSDIENMKGDLYGIAGKKKAVKKTAEGEDE